MFQKVTRILDDIAYKLFGYVSNARRSRWNQALRLIKGETTEERQRALLIFSKTSNSFTGDSDFKTVE